MSDWFDNSTTQSAYPSTGKYLVNPLTTPFRQSDLDSSTFSMDFPSFDRGISTSSIPFVLSSSSQSPIFESAQPMSSMIPSLPQQLQHQQSIPDSYPALSNSDSSNQINSNEPMNNGNQFDYSSIPAPFAPIRSYSGISMNNEFINQPMNGNNNVNNNSNNNNMNNNFQNINMNLNNQIPSNNNSYDLSDHFIPRGFNNNNNNNNINNNHNNAQANDMIRMALLSASNGFQHENQYNIESQQESIEESNNRKRHRILHNSIQPATPYQPSSLPASSSSHALPGISNFAVFPFTEIPSNIPPAGKSRSKLSAANSNLIPADLPINSSISRINSSSSRDDDSVDGLDSHSNDMSGKEVRKKIKHQLTDRQRRAKIKESMDALKVLVPLDSKQKADQATIVASTVSLVQDLKDEVAMLRERIKSMELMEKQAKPQQQQLLMNHHNSIYSNELIHMKSSQYNNSPFSSMMASLNGSGIGMWRVALDGIIGEVNMVFEMITGFSASEIVGKSPCQPPLNGNLSIMPQAFLRHFSTVSALAAPLSPTSPTISHLSSSSNSSNYGFEDSNDNSHASRSHSNSPVPSSVNSHQQQQSNHPIHSPHTIANLPVIPQSELQSFFPYTHEQIEESDEKPGSYLINHLAGLPPNHVLKLLSRVATAYGDTLESILTLCLVRTPSGAPDYVLCLSTPDTRRLVKTPQSYNHSFDHACS